MDRTRIKLAVYVDLDPTPGEFHSAESVRNIVSNLIHSTIDHYNPVISIESYDTSKTVVPVETEEQKKFARISEDAKKPSQYARPFDETSLYWVAERFDMNLVFLTSQMNYWNQRLQAYGYVFLNEIHEALGLDKTPAGQLVGWVLRGKGDGYIDFGIHVEDSNGENPKINLDFNVDGVILDEIGTRAEKAVMPVKKTPQQWCEELDVRILDPDGWREDGKSLDDEVTEEEFKIRFGKSTGTIAMRKA